MEALQRPVCEGVLEFDATEQDADEAVEASLRCESCSETPKREGGICVESALQDMSLRD